MEPVLRTGFPEPTRPEDGFHPRRSAAAFAFRARARTVPAVNEALSIECPHCGETFALAFERGEGSAEFTVDCEVCCRPMTVAVRVDADGEIAGLEVAPE